jgi:hypothetical protein
VCSSLNLSTLDQHSTGEMSYCSHREMSCAMQSVTRLFECDEQIPHQKSFHTCEKKPSDTIGVLLNDITGVRTHSMTRSDETVYCTGSINDDLMNPMLLSNAAQLNDQCPRKSHTPRSLCISHSRHFHIDLFDSVSTESVWLSARTCWLSSTSCTRCLFVDPSDSVSAKSVGI